MKPRLLLSILSLSLAMFFTSCATPGTAGNSQKPVGLIAIGHSGLTAESSDPSRFGHEALKNSWATGTNPEVNSIYLRLVAAKPEAKDHVANTAQGGATAEQLFGQAQRAFQLVPVPALVIIQTIDNDIRCDGSDAQNLQAFGQAVANVLKFITDTSPNSKILMVSQLGRPAGYAAVVASNPDAKAKNAGTGMCDMFNPDGSLNQQHVDALTGIIESYEAKQAEMCAMFPQCNTDHGTFTRYQDALPNLVPGEWNHLTIQGHAKLAELIWPVVAKLLGIQ